VFKEVDLGTNLLTGPYRHTNLAQVFREARQADRPDFVRLVDFAPYAPSYLAPAAFIAAPIYHHTQKIGVLAVQLPVDRINALMTSNRNWRAEGLGESGETYLVGADYRMRNDSRFLIQEPDRYFALLTRLRTELAVIERMRAHATSILYQQVRTAASEDALRGHSQTRIVKDYRGIPVLSSYTPLAIADVQWVLLAEIDEAEAFTAVGTLRARVRWLALLVLLVSGLLGHVPARRSRDRYRYSPRAPQQSEISKGTGRDAGRTGHTGHPSIRWRESPAAETNPRGYQRAAYRA
jgi:hypothetical protein